MVLSILTAASIVIMVFIFSFYGAFIEVWADDAKPVNVRNNECKTQRQSHNYFTAYARNAYMCSCVCACAGMCGLMKYVCCEL